MKLKQQNEIEVFKAISDLLIDQKNPSVILCLFFSSYSLNISFWLSSIKHKSEGCIFVPFFFIDNHKGYKRGCLHMGNIWLYKSNYKGLQQVKKEKDTTYLPLNPLINT